MRERTLSEKWLNHMRKNGMLYLMVAPAVILTFVLCYIPMGGIVVAFQSYKINRGYFGSPFVGFRNFEFFFNSGKAWLLTKNTIMYNLTFIVVNMVLQIIVAIIISELPGKKYKRFMQSTMILPHFISWVVVGGFAYSFLNYEYGALNSILASLGMERVNVYSDPSVWKYILPFVSAWKSVGYGSIIYLSAIAGIDKEMYESAYLDGAGIYRRIWYITLPMLGPTVIVMLLFALGGILQGNFDMFYQLLGENGQLFQTTDIIATYVFRTLLSSSNNVGIAAASGLYQQVFGFVLVVSVNLLIRKVSPGYELF